MIENVILLALCAAFLILLATKTGLRSKGQIYAPKIISDMLNCDFCFSFWVCFVLSIIFYIFAERNFAVLTYSVFACPITRLLV